MPTKRLTDRFIKSVLSPKTGRVIHWDTITKGLGLRLTAMGHTSWVVVYRHSGRLRWYTLSANLGLADARKEATKVLREAALGNDPAGSVKAARLGDTFGELAEQYMDRHAKVHKRSWREDRRALDRDLLPRLKHRKAKDVRRADILALIDAIIERGAPVLANRTLEIVRRIFNWGIEKEIVDANPCVAIKPMPESSRDRVLNEAEIRGLWATLDAVPTLASARFKLQLLTAQRPGEIRQMRWVDVDADDGWWTISAGFAKNKLAHRVPLTDAARHILDGLREITGSGEWVFPSPAGGPMRSNTKPWSAIRRSAKIDATPHDLRRTVASQMAGIGIGRLVLARLLNHVETSVTAVYDRHGYDREKREALEAWGRRLEMILTGSDHAPRKIVDHHRTPA